MRVPASPAKGTLPLPSLGYAPEEPKVPATAAVIARKDDTTTGVNGENQDRNTIADCLREVEAAGIAIARYNTYENAKDVRMITRACEFA